MIHIDCTKTFVSSFIKVNAPHAHLYRGAPGKDEQIKPQSCDTA